MLLSMPNPEPSENLKQKELNVAVGLRRQIRVLQEQAEKLEGELAKRLGSGAAVEPGTHTARFRKRTTGGRTTIKLEIN